jgi:hypothetical protein
MIIQTARSARLVAMEYDALVIVRGRRPLGHGVSQFRVAASVFIPDVQWKLHEVAGMLKRHDHQFRKAGYLRAAIDLFEYHISLDPGGMWAITFRNATVSGEVECFAPGSTKIARPPGFSTLKNSENTFG